MNLRLIYEYFLFVLQQPIIPFTKKQNIFRVTARKGVFCPLFYNK